MDAAVVGLIKHNHIVGRQEGILDALAYQTTVCNVFDARFGRDSRIESTLDTNYLRHLIT